MDQLLILFVLVFVGSESYPKYTIMITFKHDKFKAQPRSHTLGSVQMVHKPL